MHLKLTDLLNPKLTEDPEMLHQEHELQKEKKLSLADNNEDPTRRVITVQAEEDLSLAEARENSIEDLALVEDPEKTRRVALAVTTGVPFRMIKLLNPRLPSKKRRLRPLRVKLQLLRFNLKKLSRPRSKKKRTRALLLKSS